MRKILLIATLALLVLLIIVLTRFKTYDGFTGETANYEIPRIIWSYWDGHAINDFVNTSFDSIRRKLPTWDIRLLNSKTINAYLDMTTVPKNYNELKIQHQADWIRVALLRQYGGIWIDATIIINDGDAINKLVEESERMKSDFTGFIQGGTDTYIENWFMMAPKNSEFMDLLYKEYSHAISIGFMEYKKQLAGEDNIKINPRIYLNGDNITYLTQHTCIQAVAQERMKRKPVLLLKPCEDSMFKLQLGCGWNMNCLHSKLMNPDSKKLPYIKLRSKEINFDYNKYFSEGFTNYERIDWAN